MTQPPPPAPPPPPPRPSREFYEARYHFDEDVEHPNLERVWRAMRALEPLAGTVFLDLGSGVGWGARLALARGGGKIAVGLDFSRRAVTLAHRATPAAAWVQGDGTSLPFQDGAFDRVFSFGSLEHFPDLERGLGASFQIRQRHVLQLLDEHHQAFDFTPPFCEPFRRRRLIDRLVA